MAKQSGLHQLRGKVGEHSYYRQTGIVPGLVRSINQGMSSRVKTGAEYANTRLNNAEFGAAAEVAGLLGKMVVPKYRPMVLPFSQSKMAKDILEIARQSGGSWGQRVVTSADTAALCDILTSTSKKAVQDFGTFSVDRTQQTIVNGMLSWTGSQAASMVSLGITGVTLGLAAYDLGTGKYNPMEGAIRKSYSFLRDQQSGDMSITAGSADSVDVDLQIPATFAPASQWYDPHRIIVAVIMPYRSINSVDHILQEYCSFVAVPIPDAE